MVNEDLREESTVGSFRAQCCHIFPVVLSKEDMSILKIDLIEKHLIIVNSLVDNGEIIVSVPSNILLTT